VNTVPETETNKLERLVYAELNVGRTGQENATAYGLEHESGLGRVFNFKLGRFVVMYAWNTHVLAFFVR
jgi:hypothetical protein